MRRVICFFILCPALITMLSGCYDAREVNDFSYVAMLGIDKGVSDKWRITFLIPSLEDNQIESKNSSGDQKSNVACKCKIFIIEAQSFFEGVALANTSLPRKINFMHTNMIVFSEDLARSGMIGEFITPLIRHREVRRTEYVVVSKGSAEEFLEAAGSGSQSIITKELDDLLRESNNTGYFPRVNLNDMYNGIKSPYGQAFAIYGAVNNGEKLKESDEKVEKGANVVSDYYAGDVPRYGKNKIELLGCAVADGDVMVEKLTGWETRMVLIIRGEFKRGTFTIQDPKSPNLIVPIDIRPERKPQVKVSFKDGRPIINLKLQLEGDILAIQSRIDYEEPRLSPVLEKAVAQRIKEEIDKTIEKCQTVRADVFNFGYIGAMRFKTIQEWEAYKWNRQFENALVTTTVQFRIKRTGTMLNDSPIILTDGDE